VSGPWSGRSAAYGSVSQPHADGLRRARAAGIKMPSVSHAGKTSDRTFAHPQHTLTFFATYCLSGFGCADIRDGSRDGPCSWGVETGGANTFLVLAQNAREVALTDAELVALLLRGVSHVETARGLSEHRGLKRTLYSCTHCLQRKLLTTSLA